MGKIDLPYLCVFVSLCLCVFVPLCLCAFVVAFFYHGGTETQRIKKVCH